MKKLRFLLLLAFCGFIPFGCECDTPRKYIEHLRAIRLSITDDYNNSANPKVTNDTLNISLFLDTEQEFVASVFSLTSNAYATTPCKGDESLGLKNKIDSIVITSDKDFRGALANQPLDSLARLSYNYTAVNDTLIINDINRNGNRYSHYISLIKDSTETFTQKFKVAIYTHDGRKTEGETATLTWE